MALHTGAPRPGRSIRRALFWVTFWEDLEGSRTAFASTEVGESPTDWLSHPGLEFLPLIPHLQKEHLQPSSGLDESSDG